MSDWSHRISRMSHRRCRILRRVRRGMFDQVHRQLRFACATLIVLLAYVTAMGQPEKSAAVEAENNHVGTISELRDKQRALLVVFKSRVIAVDNADRAIIEDVLKANPVPKGRYRWVYN